MSNETYEELARRVTTLTADLEQVKQRLDASGLGTMSDSELLEVAEKSFSGLLETEHHLQDSASRILAAMAFLTTAAAAIYRESATQHLETGLRLWPTLWFTSYIIAVSLGSLFMLGAIWTPAWRNPHRKPEPNNTHSLLFFRRLDNGVKQESAIKDRLGYRTDLVDAYLRERACVARYGAEESLLFQLGGIFLGAAFFFLLALTSTLFLAAGSNRSWLPLPLGMALLSGAMCLASFVRSQWQLKGIPILWLVVTALAATAAFIIASV